MRDLMTRDMGVGYVMALEDVEEMLARYVGPQSRIMVEFSALKAAAKGEPYTLPERSARSTINTRCDYRREGE